MKNALPNARLAALLIASGLAAATLPTNAADKLTTAYSTLSTAAATTVAQAALAECQRQGFLVAVAVVDRSGVPLAMLRDGLAGPHTPTTAINKAWTAVSFRTNTTDLLPMTEPGKPSAGLRNLPNFVALGGGLMIRAKGELVGAVGVSGAPGGHLDDACGNAGIKAIQDSLELE
jgi:uncharacterized protein GlcG (DUF336 family)